MSEQSNTYKNNNNNVQQQPQGFFVDKKISLAFVVYLFIQIFLGGWWAATTTSDLRHMQEKIDTLILDRYTKTEAQLNNLVITNRMDSLELRIGRNEQRIEDIRKDMNNK